MENLVDMLFLAIVIVYIVDLSGFTESWRSALQGMLKLNKLKSIKPFDCSQCLVWWATIIFALVKGFFSLRILAYCALLSFLSIPMGQICIFIREGITYLLNKMMDWYD